MKCSIFLSHKNTTIASLFACLTLTTLFATPAIAADDNPLSEIFPYGVYILAGIPEGVREAGDEALYQSIERACKDLTDHHMNCVWLCNLNWKNLPMWLEIAAKHGIRVIPQGGPPGFVHPRWFKDREDIKRRAIPFFRELAEKYRNEPALLAWSVTEEVNPIPWLYEGLADLNREMTKCDPNHPAITIDFKSPSVWLNATIVKPKAFCRDVYPFFADGLNGPYSKIGSSSLLRRECRRFREAADHAGSVFWIMGQCMRIEGYQDGVERMATYRYPTPEEIRWQVWTSIQEGAKGFFYFIYQGVHEPRQKGRGEFIQGLRDRYGTETQQFQMAADVGRQIKPLVPIILKLDIVPPHEEVVYWENTPVTGQTFVHRDTGRKYLIAVNHDCKNIQPIGIEMGYWPRMLPKDQNLFDLRSRRRYEYHTFKLGTILPGDGTIFFIGTDDEWNEFVVDFYKPK